MDIIYSDGEFQYFRVAGRGFVQKGIVNGEFVICSIDSPNIRWFNSHGWDLDRVMKFARTVKLLGLEGRFDDQ